MNQLWVHPSSKVEGTSGNSGAKIYQNCDVKNTVLGINTTVGDFSRLKNCCLGDHVSIQRNAMMYDVSMGKYSYTGKNFTGWNCDIGSFCSISWNVSLGGADHDYSRVTTHSFLYSGDFGLLPEAPVKIGYNRFEKKCIIEHDVWIAANAVVCRGVVIQTGAVVAAGAVVTHDVEPYTIVAGVPARPIKKRFDEETISLLLESQWWDLPDEIIRKNYYLFNSKANVEIAQQLVELHRQANK